MSAREIFLAVKNAFQHEFGKGKARRNPWPKCRACWHRFPTVCPSCSQCDTCCDKCEECRRCRLVCQGHDEHATNGHGR